jgi:hypothetical protein
VSLTHMQSVFPNHHSSYVPKQRQPRTEMHRMITATPSRGRNARELVMTEEGLWQCHSLIGFLLSAVPHPTCSFT